MTIKSTNHTDNHWVFRLSDGTKCSVGKYREVDGQVEGVKTEEEAVEILKANYPELTEE